MKQVSETLISENIDLQMSRSNVEAKNVDLQTKIAGMRAEMQGQKDAVVMTLKSRIEELIAEKDAAMAMKDSVMKS